MRAPAFFAALTLTFHPWCLACAGGAAAGAIHGEFPPVAELLGELDEGLPLPGSRDLRDSVASAPSFERDVRALNSGGAEAQREAAARLGSPRQLRAIPFLGALLLNQNARASGRAAAAMALGRVGTWHATAFLREAAGDKAVEVRFATSLALGHVRTLEATKLIEEGPLRDRHWWVRYAAAVALGGTRQPTAVPPLARALTADESWQVRQQAARSLGELGTNYAVKALGLGLKDPDPAVRSAAARALGDVGDLESVDLLHGAFQAEKDPVSRGIMTASLRKASTAR